jgi:hypothetical protein
MKKEQLYTIVVSNIIALKKQDRNDEVVPYLESMVQMHGLTEDEKNEIASITIKNMQRIGMIG